MNTTQISERSYEAPQWALDPYRFPGLQDLDAESVTEVLADEATDHFDYFLPAPDPAQRLTFPLSDGDKRRLDLHAALTTAGIAPQPGDLEAIEALSTMNDHTARAVLRWIGSD